MGDKRNPREDSGRGRRSVGATRNATGWTGGGTGDRLCYREVKDCPDNVGVMLGAPFEFVFCEGLLGCCPAAVRARLIATDLKGLFRARPMNVALLPWVVRVEESPASHDEVRKRGVRARVSYEKLAK